MTTPTGAGTAPPLHRPAARDVIAALTAGLDAAAAAAPDEHFAICIVDAGGHVLGAIRDDRAAIAASLSAESKARTSAYLLADTGGLPPTSPLVPALTSGVPFALNVFPGGLLVRRGDVVGAVGVGGSPDPDQDLAVARAVAAALESPGLAGRADPDAAGAPN